MFYEYSIKDKVRVPPEFFGLDIISSVKTILINMYEGKVYSNQGLIVAVTNVALTGDGLGIPGDGAAHYPIEFNVLCYNPKVNTIVNGTITEIVDFGAFVSIGPIEGLVHLSQVTNEFISYNKKTRLLVTKESKKTLKKGDKIIAKISTVSMKGSIRDIKIGLTMRPDGLGKVEWILKESQQPDKKQENTKKTKSKNKFKYQRKTKKK